MKKYMCDIFICRQNLLPDLNMIFFLMPYTISFVYPILQVSFSTSYCLNYLA